jgi:hypothetical protein
MTCWSQILASIVRLGGPKVILPAASRVSEIDRKLPPCATLVWIFDGAYQSTTCHWRLGPIQNGDLHHRESGLGWCQAMLRSLND